MGKKKNTSSNIQTSGSYEEDMNQPMWICQEQITSKELVLSYDTVIILRIEKKNIFTSIKLLTVYFMTFFCAIQGLPETAIR